MKNLLIIALFLGSMSVFGQSKTSKGQVVHHVFFYLKNPGSETDKRVLKDGLRTLEAIPQVKKLVIGEPASTLKREVVVNDWHVSEIMYFENAADQDTYQSHPVHMKFVEDCGHLWEKVVVYDTRLD